MHNDGMTPERTSVTGLIWLNKAEHRLLGDRHIALLRKIDESGSITRAAKAVKMSYKAAWDAINAINNLADEPLVVSAAGGKHGGGSRLTDYGRRQIELFSLVETEYQRFLHKLSENIHDVDTFFRFIRRLLMQTSARNQFLGKVVGVNAGPINAEVTIDLGGGDHVTALITKASADNLGIRDGAEVYALFKASSIILAPTAGKLKLSARNQLQGVITSCKKGAVNAEVSLKLAGGKVVTAIITNESLDTLGLKEGGTALAMFKASSVILGVGL